MNRKQVQAVTKLTRKAIEYYEEKGLIQPERHENNYRDYSDKDVADLEMISLYRQLGLSISEIQQLLLDPSPAKLAAMVRLKQTSLDQANRRADILQQWLKGLDLTTVKDQLEALSREETIADKLYHAFPGYFGQMMFMHYQPFLSEPVADERAFADFIDFLDQLPPIELTPAEIAVIEESAQTITRADMVKVATAKLEAVEDFEKWYLDNQEAVEQYLALKETEEYQALPIVTIQSKLADYLTANHYYDTAIELWRRFSPSYDKYYQSSIQANQQMLNKLGREA